MNEKLLGQPLPRDVCQLFVDMANERMPPNWVLIKVDNEDGRVFACKPIRDKSENLWDEMQFRSLIGMLPHDAVNAKTWGIRRTDWEAMLAEITGQ